MQFSHILVFAAIATVAFLINMPLGRLRSRQRKLSIKWFVYLHLSVPLIYFMRIGADMGPWAIPFFVASAVAGQVVGGKAKA